MRLVELTTKNFAGLADGTYSLRQANGDAAQLVLVTGGPRSGKTAFLEAVIACKESLIPYGPVSRPAERARRAGERVELVTRWRLDDADRRAIRTDDVEVVLDASAPDSGLGAKRALFDRYAHDATVGKVDYFPADRTLFPKSGRLPERVPYLQQKLGRLGADALKYMCLWGWLEECAHQGAAEQVERMGRDGVLFADEHGSLQKELAAGLRTFVDSPSLVRISTTGELRFGGDSDPERGFDALPTSTRHALLFVLAYSMLGHRRSVVLVDDIERGQSPADHERFVGALVALGGDSQLIATTSSSEVRRLRAAHAVVELS